MRAPAKFAFIFVQATLLSTAAAGTAVAREVKKDEDRIVCKSQKPTGTRFAKRTCRTVAQWEVISEEQKRNYRDLRDSPGIETRRGG